jgi:hypothetical protein
MNAELFFLSITAVPIILSIFIAWFNIHRGKTLSAFLIGLIFIPVFLAIVQRVCTLQYEECLRQMCVASSVSLVTERCVNWADAGAVYALVLLGDLKIFILGSYILWRVYRYSAQNKVVENSVVYSTE